MVVWIQNGQSVDDLLICVAQWQELISISTSIYKFNTLFHTTCKNSIILVIFWRVLNIFDEKQEVGLYSSIDENGITWVCSTCKKGQNRKIK